MSRKVFFVFLCIFCVSCTSTTKIASRPQTQSVGPDISRKGVMKTEIHSIPEPVSDEISLTIGLIFAKTIFEGVVRTSYVELVITDLADGNKEFQLIIGDKERQRNFPWEVQTVKPGYFFIELPEGQYRIKSMAIPVGTTRAQEPVDIVFEVKAQQATYLGTLEVSGTKEKVKLGGVPVLQPGFEYSLKIVNEEQEAYNEFQSRFPGYQYPIATHLMQANMISNVDLNLSES